MVREAGGDDVSKLLVCWVTLSMAAEVLETDTLVAIVGQGSQCCNGHFSIIVVVILGEHVLWLWV